MALQAAAGTLARVRAIASEITGAPAHAIPDDVPLGKIPKPADDLDIVEIVLALEDAFQIEIPDQDLDDAAGGRADLAHYISVRRLAEIVERHQRAVPVNAGKRRGKRSP